MHKLTKISGSEDRHALGVKLSHGRHTKIEGSEDRHALGVKLSHGRHTQALSPNFDKIQQSHKVELDFTSIQEPTIGAVLVVENLKEWYRTNVVTNIRSDSTKNDIRTVVFETASGSVYKWEKGE